VKLQKKASWWNRKYRGATNDGSAVKSKVSLRNKRRQRGENKNIVAQQMMGIVMKTKISWRNKRWHLGENINIVAATKMGIVMKTTYRDATKKASRCKHKYCASPKVFHPHFKSQKQFDKNKAIVVD
jgi:hypothetical protein